MPGDSEHPVTLGDLRVLASPPPNPYRKATVADLVSALRAEGAIVVEIESMRLPDEAVDSFFYPRWACDALEKLLGDTIGAEAVLDALAEAQPFPPAGGVS